MSYRIFLSRPLDGLIFSFVLSFCTYLLFVLNEIMRNPDGSPLRVNLRAAQLSQKLDGWRSDSPEAVVGADLKGRVLIQADGQRAFLAGANLEGANLSRSDFSQANFQAAYIVKAQLREVILDGADLSQANLKGAYIFEASLNSANLSDADLSSVAGLAHQLIYEACGNAGTVLPVPNLEVWEKLGDYYLRTCDGAE
jgi:uncharacterized protein YjbI with pentapeptide repeats